MHMLQELERLFGGVAKVQREQMSFVPRDEGQSASGLMIPILQLLPEHFGTSSVHHTNRTKYSAVKASYFDKDKLVRKWVTEEAPGSFMSRLFGEDVDAAYAIGQLFASEEEAKAAAASRMRALVRGGGQFYGSLAKGDPWVRD